MARTPLPYTQQGVRATSMITLHDRYTLFGLGQQHEMGPVPPEFIKAGLGEVLKALPLDEFQSVVILDGTLPQQFGMPEEWTNGTEPITVHPVLDSIRQLGWEASELRPWTRLVRGEQKVVVCWRPLVEQSGGCPLFDESPVKTASNMLTWWYTAGNPWWGNGGTVGQELLRFPRLYQAPAGEANAICWHLNEKGEKPTPRAWAACEQAYTARQWSTEQSGRYEYRIDQRYAYLGAWQSALLPAKRLRQGPTTFDPKMAGLWLVELPRWQLTDLPDPAGYGKVLKRSGNLEQRWLATPTLALLEQLHNEGLHGGFEVIRSEVSRGTTITRKWAQALRDILYSTADPQQQRATKDVYTRSVGMLTRPGGLVYRPDWSLQIVSDARANTWRKLRKAHGHGMVAARIVTDEFTFVGDTAWTPALLQSLYPEGNQLGHYRHKIVDTEA